MEKFLIVAAFLSGVCGIAYEVIYARLLGAYVGDMFYVGTITIATFFIGMTIGTLWSYKHTNKLPYIEIIIGIYAYVMAICFEYAGLDITTWLANLPLENNLTISLFTFIILIIPVTAIGFSVPLFMLYLKKYLSFNSNFDAIYTLYNLGAALSVVCVELYLIRFHGISASLFFIGTVNLLIGLYLVNLKSPIAEKAINLKNKIIKHNKLIIALFIVSIASGIVQATILNVFEFIIGPLNGNFAFIVGVVLLGISFSSYFANKYQWTLGKVTLFSAFVVLAVFSSLHFFILGYAYVANITFSLVEFSYLMRTLINILFLIVTLLPLMIILGATVPATVRQIGENANGVILASGATGNAIGYVFFAFFMYEKFAIIYTIIICSLVFFCNFLYFYERKSYTKLTFISAGLLTILVFGLNWWPTYIGNISFWDMTNLKILQSADKGVVKAEEFKKYDDQASLIETSDNKIKVLHNGNTALELTPNSTDYIREAIEGTVGAFYSKNKDDILILGIGSGISVSAAADIFKNVDAVEINPSMLNIVEKLSWLNDDLIRKDNENIIINDGIVEVASKKKSYDVIFNNVSSPRYISSGKLWTKDFFDSTKDILNEGGVVVGRVTGSFSIEGVEIMQNTLQQSFKDCIFQLFNKTYLVFVCSHESLSHHSPQISSDIFIEKILRDKGWNYGLEKIILDTAFRIDDYSNKQVNSIDKPLLDFNTYIVDRGFIDQNNKGEEYFKNIYKNITIDPFTGNLKKQDEYCKSLNFFTNPIEICK